MGVATYVIICGAGSSGDGSDIREKPAPPTWRPSSKRTWSGVEIRTRVLSP